jgi:hypothetical protein
MAEPMSEPELLDYLFLENVRRQASLTPEQIAGLADEIDRATAARLRPMIDEKLRSRPQSSP